MIDLHEDLAHRVRHAVEPPLAGAVCLQVRAEVEGFHVAGTLLELDAGTDRDALDRLPFAGRR